MTAENKTPEAEAEAKPRAKKTMKQYKITFHGEGGDIEVGHNFKLNLYKRNVETTIDENYLQVVKDAVIHTTIQNAEGKSQSVTMPVYQYSVEPI